MYSTDRADRRSVRPESAGELAEGFRELTLPGGALAGFKRS